MRFSEPLHWSRNSLQTTVRQYISIHSRYISNMYSGKVCIDDKQVARHAFRAKSQKNRANQMDYYRHSAKQVNRSAITCFQKATRLQTGYRSIDSSNVETDHESYPNVNITDTLALDPQKHSHPHLLFPLHPHQPGGPSNTACPNLLQYYPSFAYLIEPYF